jgi:hypothetical protein
MSKTKPEFLSQAELDEELSALDEEGKQETNRFKELWKEAERRGLL